MKRSFRARRPNPHRWARIIALRSILILSLVVIALLSAAFAQSYPLTAPQHLGADIADGHTGQLIVSWDKVTGAAYYDLQFATSSGGPWSAVPHCFGAGNAALYDTPIEDTPYNTEACRHPGLQVTNPPTYYYYEVAACNAQNVCSTYGTTSNASNTPISCNCTSDQIPTMIDPSTGGNLLAPHPLRVPTCDTLPFNIYDICNSLYENTTVEIAAFHNTNYSFIPNRDTLLIWLPGSTSTCRYSEIMYTAQNLGFDAICVNYSNASQQDNICSGDPNCFYYIDKAKFDGTGPCTLNNTDSQDCGIDPKTNQPFGIAYYDAVLYRIDWMLAYLANLYPNDNWPHYLNGSAPNWNKIILGGTSQGGVMATYAAGLENANGTPFIRALNQSAPPLATPVNGTMTAATYLAGPPAWFDSTTIRNVYGFVSANDFRYNNTQTYGDSYFDAAWKAMGFISANHDAEWDMNCSASSQQACLIQPQGLYCGTQSNPASDNLVTFGAQSVEGGHHDPERIWNQDVFEFMILD